MLRQQPRLHFLTIEQPHIVCEDILTALYQQSQTRVANHANQTSSTTNVSEEKLSKLKK
jgi:hypothetical protein